MPVGEEGPWPGVPFKGRDQIHTEAAPEPVKAHKKWLREETQSREIPALTDQTLQAVAATRPTDGKDP